jgi:hypothetical protein
MNYKKGERVRHPSVEQWGLGEVLEDSRNDMVTVFFVGHGKTTIAINELELVRVPASEAADPLLDKLRIPGSKIDFEKYRSLPYSIAYFLNLFPEGFYGDHFFKEERGYKVRAHELATGLLNKEALNTMIAEQRFSEICKQALRVVNATNLMFPNEKMGLKDGLREPKSEKLFSLQLYRLLYEDISLEEKFVSFADMLEHIGAAKWTTVSYFPFLIHPDEFIFIKPTNTINAAEVCGYQIHYKAQLNWPTFRSILEFSQYLKTAIAELKPRDMIDVQSFMWCITPGKY